MKPSPDASAARPTVVVVGDVGLDVVVVPETSVAVDSDTRSKVRVSEGGAGANTAEWLVACGARAVLLGRVGADSAGRQVREQLTSAGVDCSFTEDPEASTCCVVVVIDQTGRRTMFPDRGASGRLHPDDVKLDVVRSADHLHLSGYVLLDAGSRPAGLAALEAARAAGLTTSVDPQAASLLTDPQQFLTDVTGVDLLLPNADEVAALTGSAHPFAASRLLEYVGTVAWTAGPRGATWVDRHRTAWAPSPLANYVDPTGCGDAFDAGLLAAWLRGADPAAALAGGVAAGAAAVARLGARPAVGTVST